MKFISHTELGSEMSDLKTLANKTKSTRISEDSVSREYLVNLNWAINGVIKPNRDWQWNICISSFLSPIVTFLYNPLTVIFNKMASNVCHLSVTERMVHHYWFEEASWLRGRCKLGDLKPTSLIVTWWLQNEIVRDQIRAGAINKGNKI